MLSSFKFDIKKPYRARFFVGKSKAPSPGENVYSIDDVHAHEKEDKHGAYVAVTLVSEHLWKGDKPKKLPHSELTFQRPTSNNDIPQWNDFVEQLLKRRDEVAAGRPSNSGTTPGPSPTNAGGSSRAQKLASAAAQAVASGGSFDTHTSYSGTPSARSGAGAGAGVAAGAAYVWGTSSSAAVRGPVIGGINPAAAATAAAAGKSSALTRHLVGQPPLGFPANRGGVLYDSSTMDFLSNSLNRAAQANITASIGGSGYTSYTLHLSAGVGYTSPHHNVYMPRYGLGSAATGSHAALIAASGQTPFSSAPGRSVLAASGGIASSSNKVNASFGSSGFGSPYFPGQSHPSRPPGAPSSSGYTGLSNLGNTCYMNAVLAALLHTPPFVRALLDDCVKAGIVAAIDEGAKKATAASRSSSAASAAVASSSSGNTSATSGKSKPSSSTSSSSGAADSDVIVIISDDEDEEDSKGRPSKGRKGSASSATAATLSITSSVSQPPLATSSQPLAPPPPPSPPPPLVTLSDRPMTSAGVPLYSALYSIAVRIAIGLPVDNLQLRTFKRAAARYAAIFGGNAQQDAHELLVSVLSVLQDELAPAAPHIARVAAAATEEKGGATSASSASAAAASSSSGASGSFSSTAAAADAAAAEPPPAVGSKRTRNSNRPSSSIDAVSAIEDPQLSPEDSALLRSITDPSLRRTLRLAMIEEKKRALPSSSSAATAAAGGAPLPSPASSTGADPRGASAEAVPSAAVVAVGDSAPTMIVDGSEGHSLSGAANADSAATLPAPSPGRPRRSSNHHQQPLHPSSSLDASSERGNGPDEDGIVVGADGKISRARRSASSASTARRGGASSNVAASSDSCGEGAGRVTQSGASSAAGSRRGSPVKAPHPSAAAGATANQSSSPRKKAQNTITTHSAAAVSSLSTEIDASAVAAAEADRADLLASARASVPRARALWQLERVLPTVRTVGFEISDQLVCDNPECR